VAWRNVAAALAAWRGVAISVARLAGRVTAAPGAGGVAGATAAGYLAYYSINLA